MDAKKIIAGAKKPKRLFLPCRVPIDLIAELTAISKELKMSRTKFVVSALWEAVRVLRGRSK